MQTSVPAVAVPAVPSTSRRSLLLGSIASVAALLSSPLHADAEEKLTAAMRCVVLRHQMDA